MVDIFLQTKAINRGAGYFNFRGRQPLCHSKSGVWDEAVDLCQVSGIVIFIKRYTAASLSQRQVLQGYFTAGHHLLQLTESPRMWFESINSSTWKLSHRF